MLKPNGPWRQYSLVNSPPGATQTLTVLEDGRAESAKLPAGLYEIQVSGPGYQTLRIPSVRIADDKTTSLQLDLIAQRQTIEEVLVVGTAIGVDPLSSVGTSRVDREAISSATGSGGDVLRALDGLPGVFRMASFPASMCAARGRGTT